MPMAWINSGDDFINPADYGIAEDAARRMKSARYILIRGTSDTRGHGTHTWAKFWRQELIDLLARTNPPRGEGDQP
jgi:homoserine O-acetyltransferase